jgi:hypothetical protein
MSYPLCLILAGQAVPMAVAGERITAPDLIRMHQGGLKDATILDFIRTYQAILSIPDTDWVGLSKAGLEPGTINSLRDHALANPGPHSDEAPAPEAKSAKKAPLPRFFVGYPHDPAAFPSWYYGPFAAEDSSASQYPGRGNPRGNRWRDNARSVWFHGRRL